MLLDAALRPISEVMDVAAADLAAGSTGQGRFAAHQARRLRWGALPASDAEQPDTATWLAINPPSLGQVAQHDPYSYLTEIAAITHADWRRWSQGTAERQAASLELERLATVVPGDPAPTAHAPLVQSMTYELEVEMEWHRFSSKDGTEPEASGTFERKIYELTTAAAPPQSIERYVTFTEPSCRDQRHYYAEDVSLEFASDGIDALFAAFGKQLVARAKADVGGARSQPAAGQWQQPGFRSAGHLRRSDGRRTLRSRRLPGGAMGTALPEAGVSL